MTLFWKNKFYLFVVLLLSVISGITAQNIPDPMSPPRLVNDFAGIFSDVEKSALEQKLLSYNDSTSTQIYVVTVTDLGGYPASDYAFRLGERMYLKFFIVVLLFVRFNFLDANICIFD